MFDFRFTSNVASIKAQTIHFANGASAPLPDELTHLGGLSANWQTVEALSNKGFTPWQLVRLLEKGVAECGRGNATFPWRARCYFERQFSAHAEALPFTTWLTQPTPKLVWLGVPHTNLVDLRHSTATGLAAVVDSLPLDAPVIGILPESSPNTRCAGDISSMALLANHCGFKLGILGGDHRATWSLLSVLKQVCNIESICYVHIDAHHDLYGIDEAGGSQDVYHSNFLVDLLHRSDVDQVCLLGCRDRPEPVLYAQQQGFDIQWIESPSALIGSAMHTHLSIDIDVLEPRLFSGVSSPLGDGWSLEKLFAVVRDVASTGKVDSVSIVEAGSHCPNTVRAVTKLIHLLEEVL